MLTAYPTSLRKPHLASPARQRGIVLMLAIVVLIIMSLAAVGLMRSLLSSNKVAGNLAFQQSALQSAEAGFERAIAWLEQNNFGTRLHQTILIGGAETVGYVAINQNPPRNANGMPVGWDLHWNTLVAGGAPVNILPADAAGNQVSYMIHRLCNGVGAPNTGNGCEVHPFPTPAGSSMGGGGSSGSVNAVPDFFYYRITARVQGPRNTVGFAQTVIGL